MKQSYMYVMHMKNTEFYKIGISDDPERRLKQLQGQTNMPGKIEITHSKLFNDAKQYESYFHDLFSSRRANGEWFRLTKDDLYILKNFDTKETKAQSSTLSNRVTDYPSLDNALEMLPSRWPELKTAITNGKPLDAAVIICDCPSLNEYEPAHYESPHFKMLKVSSIPKRLSQPASLSMKTVDTVFLLTTETENAEKIKKFFRPKDADRWDTKKYTGIVDPDCFFKLLSPTGSVEQLFSSMLLSSAMSSRNLSMDMEIDGGDHAVQTLDIARRLIGGRSGAIWFVKSICNQFHRGLMHIMEYGLKCEGYYQDYLYAKMLEWGFSHKTIWPHSTKNEDYWTSTPDHAPLELMISSIEEQFFDDFMEQTGLLPLRYLKTSYLDSDNKFFKIPF